MSMHASLRPQSQRPQHLSASRWLLVIPIFKAKVSLYICALLQQFAHLKRYNFNFKDKQSLFPIYICLFTFPLSFRSFLYFFCQCFQISCCLLLKLLQKSFQCIIVTKFTPAIVNNQQTHTNTLWNTIFTTVTNDYQEEYQGLGYYYVWDTDLLLSHIAKQRKWCIQCLYSIFA